MCIAFLILSIVVSAVRHMIAVYDQQGILPYALGMRVFCYLTDAVFLVCSVYYFGFLFGPIYFVMHYFSILFAVVGWIVTVIPNLFSKSISSIQKTIAFESSALVVLLIALAIFTVISFFVVPFKSMIDFVKAHWIILVSVAVPLALLRFIVLRSYKND